MADLAQITLVGNVGRPPVLRKTNGGVPLVEFSLGVTPLGQQLTQWYRVTAWGDEALAIAKNVEKGDRLFVQGTPLLDVWQDAYTGDPRAQICLQMGTVLYEK